jgi:hypothetical protein
MMNFGGLSMNWNLETLRVKATYLDMFPVEGRVELSRVKYGGGVVHTIVLDSPIIVFGAERDRVIVDHRDVSAVCSNR